MNQYITRILVLECSHREPSVIREIIPEGWYCVKCRTYRKVVYHYLHPREEKQVERSEFEISQIPFIPDSVIHPNATTETVL